MLSKNVPWKPPVLELGWVVPSRPGAVLEVLLKALAEVKGGVGVVVESLSAACTLLDSCPLLLLAGVAAAVGELGGVVLVQENDLAHPLEVAP